MNWLHLKEHIFILGNVIVPRKTQTRWAHRYKSLASERCIFLTAQEPGWSATHTAPAPKACRTRLPNYDDQITPDLQQTKPWRVLLRRLAAVCVCNALYYAKSFTMSLVSLITFWLWVRKKAFPQNKECSFKHLVIIYLCLWDAVLIHLAIMPLI